MNQELINRAKQKVTDSSIKTYNKIGAIYIPNVLNAQELEHLEKGIERNLQNLSSRAKVASPESDKGFFIEDFCTWQENPYYQRIIFDSPLASIAALLMQSKQIRLYHDHMLVKEPYTQTITPWHQDLPYYNIDGIQNCSFWIPVDPVERESTLEFVAGSHLGPWYTPRTFMDNQAKWFAEDELEELPSDKDIRSNNAIEGWEIKPGDVVMFNMLTLHSSKGVPKNQRRRVFSVRFMGDDTTFAPRTWATSPDFPGLNKELVKGATMNHKLFPIIYQ